MAAGSILTGIVTGIGGMLIASVFVEPLWSDWTHEELVRMALGALCIAAGGLVAQLVTNAKLLRQLSDD